MADVANSFLNTPTVAADAWARGAMVSNGNFPPDWLAKAARYNVLDEFAKNGANGFVGFGYRGSANGQKAGDLGLSNDTLALWTQDLGQSPDAARKAVATMGNGNPNNVTTPANPSQAYQTNIHKLVNYARELDYEVGPDAYGKAFAVAAGANNEQDGAHSAAAAMFARALFSDMSHDAGSVQSTAAGDMAKIGGSYVQEMAAGAAAANELQETLAGRNPAFALSPGESRAFLCTFVGDAEATQTFDNAAGAAYHDAMVSAGRLDGRLPAADANNTEHVANAYGALAGQENSVTREVVGGRDQSEEAQRALIRNILSAGVDLIPGEKIAENVPGTVWDVAKHVTNVGIEQAFGATGDPRFDATTNASHVIAVTNVYNQLSMLRDAGYPGTRNIPSDLIDPHTGKMLPARKVLGDPTLRGSLHDYLGTLAQQHGSNVTSVYDKVNETAGSYQQGFDNANA